MRVLAPIDTVASQFIDNGTNGILFDQSNINDDLVQVVTNKTFYDVLR